ncbi:hypothetical protein Pmani_023816 [Petrolisthes manimaculis]|uniref:BRCT domain-containing protein n=1 Tax=Petrolisthes manimaculis TaxID=1843537 RepID=A0AAE1U304_9EUCA|nr:hypothetical protein Pmani_023816 [Petrolisthes manimaculis]
MLVLFVLPLLNLENSYGGEIVPEFRTAEASHIITTDKSAAVPAEFKGERVTVNWLWDSIKLQQRQPTSPYIS